MEQTVLGKTGITASRVVFGGIVTMSERQEDSDRYVGEAIRRGVNYFDVAPTYGDAQQKLGNALRPYRSEVSLACKTGQRKRDAAREELEESLRLLHTDRFDVYQLHGLSSFADLEQAFAPDGAMETFIRAKKEGLVGNLGFSAHNEEVALRALELFDFDTVLFPLNWAMSLGKGFGDRISKTALEKGLGLLGMKTLAHRKWKDEEEKKAYPKSWCKTIYGDERLGVAALKYTLAMGADLLVPPGNFEQFLFAVDHIDECLDNPLCDEEREYLQSEVLRINGQYIF